VLARVGVSRVLRAAAWSRALLPEPRDVAIIPAAPEGVFPPIIGFWSYCN
jgi:hypothetical protein